MPILSGEGVLPLAVVRERLLQAVEKLAGSDEYERFLTYCSRFPAYSPRNLLLLYSQASARGFEPTRVMGFNAWKALGRHVKRGESGLRICAPVLKRDYEFDKDEVRLSCFRMISVFDVSQTDGAEILEPLKPELLSGQSNSEYFEFVSEVLGAMGFALEIVKLEGCNGRTDFVRRTVSISAGLPELQKFKTILHEFAHAKLHEGFVGDVTLAELEAESFAFMVFASLGLDSGPFSIPYLVRWCQGVVGEDLLGATLRSMNTAREFMLLLEEWNVQSKMPA